MGLQVVNPVGSSTPAAVLPAPYSGRPSEGVLGVLINGKEYSDVVLRRAVQRVREEQPFWEVLWWDKKYPSTPAPFLDEVASRTSVVLTGVGH